MDYFSTFGSLLSYLLLYKYVALFIFIFLSGVGFPVPGNTLLLAVGAFTSQSYFSFPLSLTIACIANILGDLFDYLLMRKYGKFLISRNFHKKIPFASKIRQYVKILDQYVKEREFIVIFITRFLGIAGTAVNFLSGLVPVPFKKFIFYDALGNIANIFLMLSLGFVISASWQTIANIFGVLWTGLGIFILIFAVIIIIFKSKKRTTSV